MMFTGLIEEIGSIEVSQRADDILRLTIAAPGITKGLSVGDSVSVNGVCLTAVDLDESTFVVQAVAETLARTTLGSLKPSDEVNLERPLAADGRFGGHIVQGHVDATATVVAVDRAGATISLEVPHDVARYIVEKGSVALDGVSLTVAESGGDRFTVALIPHTLASTTLGRLHPGDSLNLEVDIVAKYVERMLRSRS